HTTSIPDVMVTKKTIDDGGGQAANNGYVCWDYEIALPRVHSDYTDTKHCRMAIDDVVQIAKGTGTYYNSWIWVIDNPKAHNNGQYGMTAYTTSRTGIVRGRQNWVGTEYTASAECWSPATNFISFAPPKRD
ncbi:MAG: hypothetical protein LBR84_09650, partial [Tannerella sp.]|nr:hypothetical protein [Tannerella sp.]